MIGKWNLREFQLYYVNCKVTWQRRIGGFSNDHFHLFREGKQIPLMIEIKWINPKTCIGGLHENFMIGNHIQETIIRKERSYITLMNKIKWKILYTLMVAHKITWLSCLSVYETMEKNQIL